MSLPCPECGDRTYTYAHEPEKFDEDGHPFLKRYRKCRSCGLNLVSVETYVEKSNKGAGNEPWYMQGIEEGAGSDIR